MLLGAGEMAQQLRITILSEDPEFSSQSPHAVAPNSL